MKEDLLGVVPLYRFYDCEATRMDPELMSALEEVFEYTVGPGYSFEFHISNEEFYDVLSVVDAHNAPVLAQLNFRSAKDVVRFLRRNDLGYLVRNNAEKVETALRLDVPVGSYILIYSAAYGKNQSNAAIIKGLETYAKLDKKPFCRSQILPLLASGHLRYEDVEFIGYDLLEQNREFHEVVSLLGILKSREGMGRSFTREDIKKVLEEGTDTFKKARLSLIMNYGGTDALKIRAAHRISGIVNSEQKYNHRTIGIRFAMFLDDVITGTGDEKGIGIDDLRTLYRAGVEASSVVQQFLDENEEWNVNRIIALHEGAANALTDGWL